MLLSRSCQYGIRALLYVAIESDKSKNTDLIKIAEAMDISRPHLAKIMQDLTKRGLVRSSKRPNGGFFMTWKEKSKTLLDVIDSTYGGMTALEGWVFAATAGQTGLWVGSGFKGHPNYEIYYSILVVHDSFTWINSWTW